MSSLKKRVIVNGAVNYEGVAYPHEELEHRNGERVLIETSVVAMADTLSGDVCDMRVMDVYDEDEELLCQLVLGKVGVV